MLFNEPVRRSTKSSLSNRAVNSKACQTPKSCTAVYNSMSQYYSGTLSLHKLFCFLGSTIAR